MWTLTLSAKPQLVRNLAAHASGRIPAQFGPGASKQLRILADPEFQVESTALLKSLRECFAFKRADLVIDGNPGEAYIKTPIFTVKTWLEQVEDAKHYHIQTQIFFERLAPFQSDPAMSKFLSVFLHRVEFQYPKAQAIDNTIDLLESILPATALNYPLDLSYVKVNKDDIPFSVTFEPERVSIEGRPSNSWTQFLKALDALKGAFPVSAV